MQELNLKNYNGDKRHSWTVRDLTAIVFRHRRPMALSFLGIVSGAILMTVLQPDRYDAAMKILIKRDRADAVVTPEATAAPQYNVQVTEEELNSEVELLKSKELLERIVLAYNLQHRNGRTGLGILNRILPKKVADLVVGKGSHQSGSAHAIRLPADGVAIASGVPNSAVANLPSSYVPARPLAEVLPAHLAPSISGSRPAIEVRVRIDETGHVTEARALGNVPKNDGLLAYTAINAAKQWIFEPARLDGKEIPSDHTIGFEFHPENARLGNGITQSAAHRFANFVPDMPSYDYNDASDVLQPKVTQPMAPPSPEEALRIASAVRLLQKKLTVDVMRKTNLIEVNYESPDPELSARVLNTLANLYLEKHVRVHRPPGAFDFFHQATERYRQGLGGAEARLVDFSQRSGVVSAPLEKEVALQKLADFQVTLKQTGAAIAEDEERIRSLQQESAFIPSRMVTQVRNADDATLLSQLRSNLLMLEQRRTELLGKFQPTYRLVQELEVQIAQTREALVSAEKSKVHDETTDRDPTYEWVRAELAKAKADLAGLQARAKATALSVRSYEDNARSLEQKEVVQQSLVRTVKAAEEHYLLYLRKEEEARISDALDRGRILNVAIAEAATTPSMPSNHRSMTLLVGFFLATLVSLGLAFTLEYLDATFRTASEVESILGIPVLAAIPRPGKNGDTAYVS